MNNKLFGYNLKNVTLKPFSYIKPSLVTTYTGILILLIPQIAMLFLAQSYDSLLILAAAFAGSVLAETGYALFVRTYRFSFLSSAINGIIIGMLLPSTYPVAGVFFITFAGLILTKYAFGGFYNSWINPCAIVVAAAYFINLSAFPDFLISTADLQGKNTALLLIQNGSIPAIPTDSAITAFLNKTVFKLFRLSIPEGYVSMFWDSKSIIPAFRFNLLTLISSIILISFDIIDCLIPFIFIAVYSMCVRFLGPLMVNGISCQGDILLALLTGGTLFSTLYVLQWHGTTPITALGKVIYGLLSGLTAFLIMGMGTSPVGYVFTVLVMNVVSPLIETIESKNVKFRIERILIPRIKEMREVNND